MLTGAAIAWILSQTGADTNLLSRLQQWLTGNAGLHAYPGWPWFPGTSAWVTPTALSMLALRKAMHGAPLENSAQFARASKREQPICWRMCAAMAAGTMAPPALWISTRDPIPKPPASRCSRWPVMTRRRCARRAVGRRRGYLGVSRRKPRVGFAWDCSRTGSFRQMQELPRARREPRKTRLWRCSRLPRGREGIHSCERAESARIVARQPALALALAGCATRPSARGARHWFP